MDMFQKARVVRLRSHHDKYLVADDDEEAVCQDRNGSSRAARWAVEVVEGGGAIRLKSAYGKYLTASNVPFLLGVTGRKVLQTQPRRLDSSVEWEPVREGVQVRLRTRYGNFLRGNGGLPPWRNSVTHDVPHRSSTQDWVLWDLDVLEVQPAPVDYGISYAPARPPPERRTPAGSFSSPAPGTLSKQESLGSLTDSPPKQDGRTIQYYIGDDKGNVNEGAEGCSFIFKGSNVEELTNKLKEETGLDDIIICTKSPLNGKLFPLRLQLPPNNAAMTVIVVSSTSREQYTLEVAKSFSTP